jgi:hypothetical protein
MKILPAITVRHNVDTYPLDTRAGRSSLVGTPSESPPSGYDRSHIRIIEDDISGNMMEMDSLDSFTEGSNLHSAYRMVRDAPVKIALFTGKGAHIDVWA